MALDPEILAQLQEQLRAHRRRVALQRYRQALFGAAQTGPEILIDIEDGLASIHNLKTLLRAADVPVEDLPIDEVPVALLPPSGSDTDLQTAPLWRGAIVAIYKQEWGEAERLLAQIVQAHPSDKDAQAKLAEVRAKRKCHENYLAIIDLCDEEQWTAAQAALEELDRRCPNWPDPEGLHDLIESHLRRNALLVAARDAHDRKDWDAVTSVAHRLREIDPGDRDALALLDKVRMVHHEAEQRQQQRVAQAHAYAIAGNFVECIDLLDTNLTELPADSTMIALLVDLSTRIDVPLDWRLRAGKMLGKVGDPRIPLTLPEWRRELDHCNADFGKPDGYWCFVRPGTYLIGGWHSEQFKAQVELPAFWIARYPITIAQFKYFAEIKYKDIDRWYWKRSQYAKLEGLEQLRSGNSNQPINLANWYDATFFAAWLKRLYK